MMDVASRADLKSELLKELDRHRTTLNGYRGHPGISEAALDEIVGRIDQSFGELNALHGKVGHALAGNEWLMGIRSRVGIPGGTCSFDLPGYHAWQQHEPVRRRADLVGWVEPMRPLAESLQVLLGLLRDSAVPQRVHAPAGQYQQRLSEGRTFQLLRLRMDPASGLVPEITGHRLLVSVRMMRPDAEGRLKPAADDTDFELTLCALAHRELPGLPRAGRVRARQPLAPFLQRALPRGGSGRLGGRALPGGRHRPAGP